MGREIRRVPPDWQHPRDGHRGDYIPLYDQDYQSAAKEWAEEYDQWKAGTHPSYKPTKSDGTPYYFWEYSSPPDEEYYRDRAWTEAEATHYQIYETVSEGTPVSPVFASLDALTDWLVGQGHSRSSAEAFAKSGWVPSMVAVRMPGQPTKFMEGIDSADYHG